MASQVKFAHSHCQRIRTNQILCNNNDASGSVQRPAFGSQTTSFPIWSGSCPAGRQQGIRCRSSRSGQRCRCWKLQRWWLQQRRQQQQRQQQQQPLRRKFERKLGRATRPHLVRRWNLLNFSNVVSTYPLNCMDVDFCKKTLALIALTFETLE